MKILVQWAQQTPTDWIETDAIGWTGLPSRPLPAPGELGGLDDTPGWIFNLNVQGLHFGGADHYAVESVANDGIKVTVWYDDPDDVPAGERWAVEWTLRPLAPDAHGCINTLQSRVVYAEPAKMAQFGPVENTTYLDWSAFVEPAAAITRHGIWVDDALVPIHEAAASIKSWRCFGDHLDPSELDENGEVKNQYNQGRFPPPQGTITYFLHDTTLANGIHAADHEIEMEETDVAVSVGVEASIAASTAEETFCWTTLASSPNDGDWPNGEYKFQIDVQTAMNVDGGYGFLTLNGVVGHMARINSGLTSDLESWTQTEAAFSGTGIKTGSRTLDPGAGAAGDRWEGLLVAHNTNASMAGSLKIRHDDSDSFSQGPWSAASPQSVTTAFLTSGAALFAATVLADQAVTGAFLSSGSTLFAPTVSPDQAVTGAHVSSGAVLNAPSVAYRVAAAFIASAVSLFVPTVVPDLAVTTAFLASGAALFAPTVETTQSVTGAHIASGAALFSPAAAYEVGGAHIASSSALNVPSVAYNVDAATIAAGSALFAPSVATGPVSVTGAHIASGAVLSQPSLAYEVNAAFIASTAVLNVPAVAYEVDTAFLASGVALFAPTVSQAGAQAVTGAHISSAIVLSEPSVAYVVDAASIASSAVLFAPSAAYNIDTAVISSTAALFAPTVLADQAVTGAHISSAAALTAPSVAYRVDAAAIASTAALFAPSVAPGAVTVIGAHIGSGVVLFAPAVSSGLEITGAHIASTLALFAPASVHFAARHLVSVDAGQAMLQFEAARAPQQHKAGRAAQQYKAS